MPRPRDLLLLVRAPLAATAVADVATGFLLPARRAIDRQGHPDVWLREPVAFRALALAAAASCALYWAGMALNDVADRERDRTLAPHRPIPSGRLRVGLAAALGVALLALGVGLAGLAGGTRGLALGGTVAAAVLLYDGLLKRSRVTGAAGMAACRGANVLLGAAVASAQQTLGSGRGPLEGFDRAGVVGWIPALAQGHALAVACYVFFLTWLSTFEDEDAAQPVILVGFAGALGAVVALGTRLPIPLAWLALGPLVVLVAWRLSRSVRAGTRASGRATTRWLLGGILLLDAGALLGVGLPAWALAVLALALPYRGGALLLLGPGPPPAAGRAAGPAPPERARAAGESKDEAHSP